MCTQYQPLNTLEELVAAQKQGDIIEVCVSDGGGSGWQKWNGTWWSATGFLFRAVIQPKTKTITMCKALFNTCFGYSVRELDVNRCSASEPTFVKIIENSEYTIEVPNE